MLKIQFILGWLPHHTLGNFSIYKLYIQGVIRATCNTDTRITIQPACILTIQSKKNKFPAKIQVISILNNHPDKKWLHTFGNYQWELKIWKLQYISICPTNNIIHVQSTWINIICVKKATLYVRHGDTADSKCCNDKGYRYINKFKQQKIL